MNDSGQLYTIEGVAAAVLMVVTAYLIISTTTVLTPQDVHIIDMQLEQLGSDALAVMDTADSYGNETHRTQSTLVMAIAKNDPILFRNKFLTYANATTSSNQENLSYSAIVYYRNISSEVNSYVFDEYPYLYYRENAVKISRWVYLPDFDNSSAPAPDMRSGDQSVLLEVLLWRV